MEFVLKITDARGDELEAHVTPAPAHEPHGWLVELYGSGIRGAFPITIPDGVDMGEAIQAEARRRWIHARN